jgi:hypothetical protein
MPKLKRLWVPFTIERWAAAHRWKLPSAGHSPDMDLRGVFLAAEGDRLTAHVEALTLVATKNRARTHVAHKALLDGFKVDPERHLEQGHWVRDVGFMVFRDADDVRTAIRYEMEPPTENPGNAVVFDLRAPADRRNTLQTNYMTRLFKRLNKQGDQ